MIVISDFTVSADKKFALAGVDFVPGERIKFDLLHSKGESGKSGRNERQRTICEIFKATKSQQGTLAG